MTAKKMADLPYHFGVKFNVHLTAKQKEIVSINSKAFRETYNAMIDINDAIFKLRHINLTHYKHPHYYKLINWLVKNKEVTQEFATFMVEHHFVSSKTIQKAKAKHAYQLPETTGSYIFDEKIKWLKDLKYTGKTLGNIHRTLYNKKIDSCCLSLAIRNYKNAWKMFKKVHTSGIPAKKKENYFENYQTSCMYSVKVKKEGNANLTNGTVRFLDRHHLRLPKIGIVYVKKIRNDIWNRRFEIKTGTVSIKKSNTDVYTVSMQLGAEKPFVKPFAKTKRQIGIDLNVSNFLVTNEGIIIDNPNWYKKNLVHLKKQQRKLSIKQEQNKRKGRDLKECKNFQRQRLKVARINQKIANQRDYWLNILSKQLLKQNDLIVSEDMRSKNMLKERALSQRIWDVGWRLFIQKLDYKANLYNKEFITVDSCNTTQMCSNCGYICGSDYRHKKLSPSIREWTCPNCGTHHDRDLNASINVLNLGLKKKEQQN